MKRNLLKILVVGLLAAFLAGCRTAPVHNVSDAPVGRDAMTQEQVKQAIIRAGASLGWQMRPVDPGHIVGTLYLRDHMAQVDVNYDSSTYDIEYKDSRNLRYDGNNIHSNYNGWIQNLDRAIMAQIQAQ